MVETPECTTVLSKKYNPKLQSKRSSVCGNLTSSELALTPYPLPIEPKQQRRGNTKNNSHKSQHGHCPPIPKRFDHVRCKQRKPKSGKTPQNHSCCDPACGI